MAERSDAPVAPTPASTLILVRPGGSAPEILLLKRGADARFMPNAHVFAGGAVDADDGSEDAYRQCAHFDDRQASARLNLASGGLRFFIAAIREAFEESGLLLAYDRTGNIADLSGWTEQQLHAVRSQLGARQISLAALCRSHGWTLAAHQLAFFSHWVTPPSSSRRFDTRFFSRARRTGKRPRWQTAKCRSSFGERRPKH